MSKYKYFFQDNFLESDLHDAMLDPKNQCANIGLLINEDGSLKEEGNFFKNRYGDNSVLLGQVSKPLGHVIELIKSKLIENGMVTPVIYNMEMLQAKIPDPHSKNNGWHKDFNPITHVTDLSKLWITMLSFTDQEVNSELMVSPSPEGPEFWNIGGREKLTSNKLFGHTLNVGHQYTPGSNNNVTLMYCRWYEGLNVV